MARPHLPMADGDDYLHAYDIQDACACSSINGPGSGTSYRRKGGGEGGCPAWPWLLLMLLSILLLPQLFMGTWMDVSPT